MATQKNDPEQGQWWYLSFGDGGFHGACVVRGRDLIDAVINSRTLGCHPEGQVKVVGGPIPEDLFGPELRNRQLRYEEIIQMLPAIELNQQELWKRLADLSPAPEERTETNE